MEVSELLDHQYTQSAASLSEEISLSSDAQVTKKSDVKECSDQSVSGANSAEQKKKFAKNKSKISHSCQICDKIFSKKSNLQAHLNLHLRVELECKFCQKKFFTRSGLDRHVSNHFGDAQKFECSKCDRKFNRKFSLDRHLLNHNKDLCPFTCDICGLKFAEQMGLKKHQIVKHTGIKSFCCQQCDKCFHFNSDLIKHQKVHSGIKEFTCCVCEMDFNRSENLKRHMLVHELDNYKCKPCGIIFKHAISYRKHQSLKHKPVGKVTEWKVKIPRF